MFKLSFHFSLRLSAKGQAAKRPVSSGITPDGFVHMAMETIRQQAAVRSKSTIDNYETALRSFTDYVATRSGQPGLDHLLMEGYQQWLLRQGVTLNSVSCYMRSLRSLLNKTYPHVLTDRLFEHVFTGKMRTDKRSISIDDVCRISRLQLPPASALAFSRDLFLFSLYALGMPFVDMAFLRKTDISNGYICYNRHKTGQRIRIKIEPPMQHIIERYGRQAVGVFVFPILTSPDSPTLNVEYETARSRYNRHLRRLGCMACIPRTLTSYVARHSWASAAYHSNIELSVISKAMGHASPNTTLTYIREIDDRRIEAANSMLIRMVTK